MTSSKLTQSVLVVIALLLMWLAIRPNVPVPVVHAAGPVQYKVVDLAQPPGLHMDNALFERQLSELGKDGWTLTECDSLDQSCVFKR
jgi:hypothetical protein